MCDPTVAFLTALFSTLLIAAGCVWLHHSGLRWLNCHLGTLEQHQHRRALLRAVSVVLLLHLVETMLFGLGIYALAQQACIGGIRETVNHQPLESLDDALYYSMTVYTSLGFGDVAPSGMVRFMTGMEALLGLVLIGWSASFLHLEMQQFWSNPRED